MATGEKNLKHVARGAGIVLLGALLGAALQLISGMITVRLVLPSEYGLYTLAAVIVGTAATLANLGFGNGAPQLIAKYWTAGDIGRARGIAVATLVIVALVSGTLTMLTIGLSPQIAKLFGKPELSEVLQPFALILWPAAMTVALVSVFRGLASTWPKVVFDELAGRALRIFGLVLVAFMGWGLGGIVWITVASTLVSFVAFAGYAYLTVPRQLPAARAVWGGGELIKFSLPLFGNNVIEILMVSASTLLLGYFMSADFVGQYNVAVTLARLLEMPLLSLAFIYLPIATAIHGGQGTPEVGSLYISSTKWISVITLPVFLAIMVDAEFIVGVLFGHAYVPAAGALRVLSVGYFIHTALGPNGMTLLAFGARRAIFLSTGIAALINVALGIILMPTLGALGAAIAVAVALVVSNIFISVNLYLHSGIHPLKAPYLRTLAFSAVVAMAGTALVAVIPAAVYGLHVLLLAGITLACLIAPVITRSVDQTDLATLSAIERKLSGKTICSEVLAKWCRLHPAQT